MRYFGVLLLLTTALFAQDATEYRAGKLLDMQGYREGLGPFRRFQSFCMAIQLDDIAYLTDYVPWVERYQPTEVVGDPVQIKIKGDTLYLRTGKTKKKWSYADGNQSKEVIVKMRIVRRERITSERTPPTCVVPIANK